MPIITISRGSYSRGKELAELVAEELGYECISRDVLLETSVMFDIPEIKLIRAIHDAPSILERLNHKKEHFVAHIRAALLDHVRCGDVVYHGLAGHFFLTGVSHVLKIRVIANFEDRVAEEVRREGIAPAEAARLLHRDDLERQRWSHTLYGADTTDPQLYDMTLHIDSMTVPEAAELVVKAASLPCFQPTPESEAYLHDRYLEAQAIARMLDAHYAIEEVHADKGDLSVCARGTLTSTARQTQEIAHVLRPIKGVGKVRITLQPEP